MTYVVKEGMENGKIKYEINGPTGAKSIFLPQIPNFSVCVYDVVNKKEEKKKEKDVINKKRKSIDKIICKKRRKARADKATRKIYNMGTKSEEKVLAPKKVGFTVVEDEKDVLDLVDKALISEQFLK